MHVARHLNSTRFFYFFFSKCYSFFKKALKNILNPYSCLSCRPLKESGLKIFFQHLLVVEELQSAHLYINKNGVFGWKNILSTGVYHSNGGKKYVKFLLNTCLNSVFHMCMLLINRREMGLHRKTFEKSCKLWLFFWFFGIFTNFFLKKKYNSPPQNFLSSIWMFSIKNNFRFFWKTNGRSNKNCRVKMSCTVRNVKSQWNPHKIVEFFRFFRYLKYFYIP